MATKFRRRPARFALACIVAATTLAHGSSVWGQVTPAPKPVPRMQAIPLPNFEISFQREGVELTRYHFSTNQNRPFLYPIVGPSGRSLTRMGHPHDPVSHSHHNSLWISHNDVNGLSSWDDRGEVRILHQRVEQFEDGENAASATVLNHWRSDFDELLVEEHRRITVQALPGDEWMLVLDLQLEAPEEEVTFGKTPFGLVGVRMAKTIGVTDGGGMIRNSLGGVNEKQVFWKAAQWVDYSGPITAHASDGITLMDHPSNPNHPCEFHVRDDGWMGASLTFNGARSIPRGQSLLLRYGFYIHAGMPSTNALQRRWVAFSNQPLEPIPSKTK